MRLSLHCLDDHAHWVMPDRKEVDHQFPMVIRGAPLRLRCPQEDGTDTILHLVATLRFTPFYDEEGREYRLRTSAYRYTLSDEDRQEMISWHWHPETFLAPHLHAGEYDHVPTGRVTFESIVRYLINDHGVRVARTDWSTVLTDQEERHKAYRSWA